MATWTKLRLRAVFEAGLEPRDEVLAGVEQSFKGDGARDGAVVEEDGDGDARLEAQQIRARGVDGIGVRAIGFGLHVGGVLSS